ITYRHLEPMGFEEFLEAIGETKLVELLSRVGVEPDGELIDAVHERLLELFRDWVLVGGMPAAVGRWAAERNLGQAREAQRDVLATLRDDFNKYGSRALLSRLTQV